MKMFETAIASFFSSEQLKRVQSVKIGVAGAGGIGSNCAVMLVRSGFKNFTIVDFDRVEPSNLNRQVYLSSHIGRLKVECLKELLLAINSEVSIITYNDKINNVNAARILGGCDIIIEAFDNACSKAELFSVFLHSGKLLVGVSGIGGIGNINRIDLLKVSSDVFIVGDRVSEVGGGGALRPYAPRVMVAAAMMADTVLDQVVNGHNS
jgi:sulfur carrier protein ThiS adenylyltransferase